MQTLERFLLFGDVGVSPWSKECLDILYGARAVGDITEYVSLILSKLEHNDHSAVDEALHVALPLVYRLGLDDSSGNARIASAIKDKCCTLRYPAFYKALENEINDVCISYCHTTFNKCGEYVKELVDETSSCVRSIAIPFKVYGRRKSPYSIFEKLVRYSKKDKHLKDNNSQRSVSLRLFLEKFEDNIIATLNGSQRKHDLWGDDINWIIPDLIGVTVQFSHTFVRNQNLGASKRRYLRVFCELARNIKAHIYYGPSFSEKWHINRLVFYALFTRESNIRLPAEIFIRTGYDYNIGYANYWRYKGVSLLEATHAEGVRKRAELLRELKACEDFSQVQDLIFREVTSGQLCLF